MDKVQKKLKHLKKYFKFKDSELEEIKKMYSGDFFDELDKGYQKLLEISYNLCHTYNNLAGKINKNQNLLSTINIYFKKQAILKRLFPIKKIIADVGENLEVVIGLVDFEGKGFANRAVKFSKYCLTTCGNYTIFGINIKVGNSTVVRQNNLIKLGRIVIGENSWICGGVEICNNVTIGKQTVIGSGAIVEEDILDNYIALGRPAKNVFDISKNYVSKDKKIQVLDEEQRIIIKEHLKKYGYSGNLKEYWKIINCETANSINITLGRMYLYTHRLCSEYNNFNTTKKRKEEILNILFPNHGNNLIVGNDLYVDLLGTTKIGENVNLGNSVYLGGRVEIGNNVTIENNVLLFGTGHSVKAEERKVKFSFKKGFYNDTYSNYIKIANNVHIGSNCVIAPGTELKTDLNSNLVAVNNKIF